MSETDTTETDAQTDNDEPQIPPASEDDSEPDADGGESADSDATEEQQDSPRYGYVTRVTAREADVEAILLGQIDAADTAALPEVTESGGVVRVRRTYEPEAVVELPQPLTPAAIETWLTENRDHPAFEGYDWYTHEQRDLLGQIVSVRARYQDALASVERELATIEGRVASVQAREALTTVRNQIVEIIDGDVPVQVEANRVADSDVPETGSSEE